LIRQYRAQRRQGGNNPLGVGVVATGTIVYLQDDLWWRDRYRGSPVCRNPWIVTAFLNGTVAAARRNRDTGLWEDVYVAGRSDMAVIRSLRDGRERKVAVRTLILHDDEGLVRQPSLYPTLPNMRLWRAGLVQRKPGSRTSVSGSTDRAAAQIAFTCSTSGGGRDPGSMRCSPASVSNRISSRARRIGLSRGG